MLRGNDRQAPEVVHIGAFKLFPSQRLLTKDAEVVKLGSRSFDILLALADKPGEIVSQKELIAKVWPDLFVEGVSLRVHVSALRKALDCDGTSYLANVPGRGYCLVAPVMRGKTEELPGSVFAIEPEYPLPLPRARMVGRDEDVRAICEKLLARRFVTVVGPGGVGKTTTVLSAAHKLLGEFLGAVCFVELSPVDSPFLASAITSAFRLPVRTQDPITELATHLRGKRVLLILDSCEHLIAEAARVAERLFREASDLYILATSREALRVEGEHIYLLPPLVSPPEDDELTVAEALAYPAVQLFVDRIVSAGFSSGLVDEEAQIVSGMCRQLGGIALAIELAAGRAAVYGIRNTASLLNGQFALLWPGRRTAPPRQQTLNATLDWSYDLLSDDERRVFRQLSVFRGGFTLDAACRMETDDELGSLQCQGIVASLVAKSLVSPEPGASNRYRLLDMTRAYADSKLQRAGESLDLRRKHAIYYRDLLAEAALENQDPRALAADIDNIRAALSWSFKPSGDAELGVQLAALSATAWLGLGLLTECHDWLRTAYQLLLDDTPAPLPQQLGICMALWSTLLFTASDIGEFKPVWDKAFGLAVSLGDIESQMSCHLALWAFQVRVPRYAVCLGVAEDCLRTAERADNSGAIGQAEWMLGQSNLHLGRLEEAMSHYQRFMAVDTEASRLAMMKQTGYDRRSDALGNLSCLSWLTGSPEKALRMGSEAMSVARSLEFPLPIAVASMWNGLIRYFIEPDLDEIEADMVDLVEHARTHGIVQFQGFGLSILGLCQARRSQLDEALRLVAEGLRLQDASHIRVFHPVIRSELAEAAANLGRPEDAEAILLQNDREDVNDPEHWWTPEILRIKGVTAAAAGRVDQGADLCRRAVALARRRGALSFELRAATTLGQMRAPNSHEALELLDSVYGRFAEGLDTPDLLKAKRLIDELKISSNRPDLQNSI